MTERRKYTVTVTVTVDLPFEIEAEGPEEAGKIALDRLTEKSMTIDELTICHMTIEDNGKCLLN